MSLPFNLRKGAILSLIWCREGTFIAFDCETPQMRDAFVKEMRLKGINMGGCGDRGAYIGRCTQKY